MSYSPITVPSNSEDIPARSRRWIDGSSVQVMAPTVLVPGVPHTTFSDPVVGVPAAASPLGAGMTKFDVWARRFLLFTFAAGGTETTFTVEGKDGSVDVSVDITLAPSATTRLAHFDYLTAVTAQTSPGATLTVDADSISCVGATAIRFQSSSGNIKIRLAGEHPSMTATEGPYAAFAVRKGSIVEVVSAPSNAFLEF